MLTSLFENNREKAVVVHVLGVGLSEEGKKDLIQITDKYDQQINFYTIQDEMLKNCPIDVSTHFTVAIYGRIFLPEILPEGIEKVLYVDSDIIIRHDISELWNTDMEGKAVACVEDMWSEKQNNYDRLQYDREYSYFNSGVLLLNLAYWRAHHVARQTYEYIRNYPERLLFPDQDALNAVLHDKKLFLPFTWNMQDGFYRRERHIRKEAWPEIDAALGDPAVVHYTGGKKPWHFKCVHPLKHEYLKYVDMTKWKGERPPAVMSFRFLQLLNGGLERIGLRKSKYSKFS